MENNIKKISAVFLSIIGVAFFILTIHLQSVHAAAPEYTASGRAHKLLAAGQASTYQVMIEPEKSMLKADGAASTVVRFRVSDSSGRVPTGFMEAALSASRGEWGASSMVLEDGVGTNVFRSEALSKTAQAVISVVIVEADDPSFLGLSGSVAITLYAGGDADAPDSTDNTETGNTDVSKMPASQKITCKPDKVKNGKAEYGVSFSLHAQSSGNGKLSYKSSNSKILSVSASGKVKAKGIGSASIIVTATGTAGYKAASRTLKLAVVPKRVQLKEWSVTNNEIFCRWASVPQVDGYEFSMAQDSQFSNPTTVKWSKTSITIGGIYTKEDALYFRVRAYKKAGGKTYYGKWSDTKMKKMYDYSTERLS